MLARGMRPLNVDRARKVMEIHETLQKWIGGPGPVDPARAASYLFNSQNSGPEDTHWKMIMVSLKEWVWQNAAVVTLYDMESHLHELIEQWTVHGPEAIHAIR